MIVTGGAGGLGAAVVRTLLEAGWRVVAPVRGGATARLPEGTVGVEADLTVAEDVERAVALAAQEVGAPLKAVVNLAGGFAMGGLVHETPVEDFEAMLRLNLRPTYLVTAAALPYLVAAGGGSVVCVSSRAAVAPFAGAVAVEYRKHGVRANTVLPSVIDTPLNRREQPDADHSRWVTPEEIARVISFLVSDASAPTSGASIPVYGRA